MNAPRDKEELKDNYTDKQKEYKDTLDRLQMKAIKDWEYKLQTDRYTITVEFVNSLLNEDSDFFNCRQAGIRRLQAWLLNL